MFPHKHTHNKCESLFFHRLGGIVWKLRSVLYVGRSNSTGVLTSSVKRRPRPLKLGGGGAANRLSAVELSSVEDIVGEPLGVSRGLVLIWDVSSEHGAHVLRTF